MVRIIADVTAVRPQTMAERHCIGVAPLLTLKNGQTATVKRQCTLKNAVNRPKELIAQQVTGGAEARLTVMHFESPERATKRADDLSQMPETDDVLVMNFASAIVTHAIPGAVAVGFFIPEVAT